MPHPAIGHRFLDDGSCQFVVWAPLQDDIVLEILDPSPRQAPLSPLSTSSLATSQTGNPAAAGYWTAIVPNVAPGARYNYLFNGDTRRPDPASRLQAEGVHGPSVTVNPDAFAWKTACWRPTRLEDMVLYELHIGAFTPQGTFAAAIEKLPHLVELGVNAVEVMPVNHFPGQRNWGYDGVGLFGVQASYGGPEGFQQFVDACHAHGVAVLLDMVFNHLGPEGNYLRDFGPYFTDRYQTPWGEAVNFDGPGSDAVREYCVQSALYFFNHFRVDGFRLDAIHAIFDQRPEHILAELSRRLRHAADLQQRPVYFIGESHLNDPRLTTPLEANGLGMDSVWNDDFHHIAHMLLTGEQDGYYQDYHSLDQLAAVLQHGFCFQGEFSSFRGRSHGQPAGHLPATAVTNWLQTHDQVGNRMLGERLSVLTTPEGLRLGAALLATAPGVPMLFMGEEWGETNPFQYFIDHGDAWLVDAVREGRAKEFSSFQWKGTPPDPASPDTYHRSRLDWRKPAQSPHSGLLALHKELFALRRAHAALREPARWRMRVWPLGPDALAMLRWGEKEDADAALCLYHFGKKPAPINLHLPDGGEDWAVALDTNDVRFGGPGAAGLKSLAPSLTLPAQTALICLRRG